MSERTFRTILGGALLLLLALDWQTMVYTYVGILLFEGITNWRIPIIITRLRYGSESPNVNLVSHGIGVFEAERMLRFVVALFLIAGAYLLPEVLWIFPWFVGVMLLVAGLTNICPMVMALRWVGLR